MAAAKLSCARLLTEERPLVCRVLGRARAWLKESSSCSISGSSASESSTAGRSLTTCRDITEAFKRSSETHLIARSPIGAAKWSVIDIQHDTEHDFTFFCLYRRDDLSLQCHL